MTQSALGCDESGVLLTGNLMTHERQSQTDKKIEPITNSAQNYKNGTKGTVPFGSLLDQLVMCRTRYSERVPMRILGPQMPKPELM